MGEKQSKTANSRDAERAKAVTHDSRLFRKESEFWFLIDRVDLAGIPSPKKLHERIACELSDLQDQIEGVSLENDGHSTESQGFVYFKSYESAKDACDRMNLKQFGSYRINTVLVPRGRENNEKDPNAVLKEQQSKKGLLKQQHEPKIPNQEKETDLRGQQHKTDIVKWHDRETLQQPKLDEQVEGHFNDQPSYREGKQRKTTSISNSDTRRDAGKDLSNTITQDLPLASGRLLVSRNKLSLGKPAINLFQDTTNMFGENNFEESANETFGNVDESRANSVERSYATSDELAVLSNTEEAKKCAETMERHSVPSRKNTQRNIPTETELRHPLRSAMESNEVGMAGKGKKWFDNRNEDIPCDGSLSFCFVPPAKDSRTHPLSEPAVEQPDVHLTSVRTDRESVIFHVPNPESKTVAVTREENFAEEQQVQDSRLELLHQQQLRGHRQQEQQKQQEQPKPVNKYFSEDESHPLIHGENLLEGCFDSNYRSYTDTSDTSSPFVDAPQCFYSPGEIQHSSSYDFSSRENYHTNSKKRSRKARHKRERRLQSQDQDGISSKEMKEDRGCLADSLPDADNWDNTLAMTDEDGTISQGFSKDFKQGDGISSKEMKEDRGCLADSLPDADNWDNTLAMTDEDGTISQGFSKNFKQGDGISSKEMKEDRGCLADSLPDADNWENIPTVTDEDGAINQGFSKDFNCEMSDISEFNVKNKGAKENFVVVLYNLPVPYKAHQLVSLFKGKFEGFKRAFLTKQKGRAIAAFSSAKEATNCAEKMKGLIISDRKINVRAKITNKGDSLLIGLSFVDSGDVEGGEQLETRHTQDENLPRNNISVSHLDRHSLEESGEIKFDEKVKSWLTQYENPPIELSAMDKGRESSSSDFTEEQFDGISETDRESVASGVTCAPSDVAFVVTVSNLPPFVTNKKLHVLFHKKCEGVKKAHLTEKYSRGRKGEVVFNTREQMENCVKKMDKSSQFGQKIRVHVREPVKRQNKQEEELQDFSQPQKVSQSSRENRQTHVQTKVAEEKLNHEQEMQHRDQQKQQQEQQILQRQQQEQKQKQHQTIPQKRFAETDDSLLENRENCYQGDVHGDKDDFDKFKSKMGSFESRPRITNPCRGSEASASRSFSCSETSGIDSEKCPRKAKQDFKRPLQNLSKQDDVSSNENKDEQDLLGESAPESEIPIRLIEGTLTNEGPDDLDCGTNTIVIRSIPNDTTQGCFRRFIDSKGSEGVVKLTKSKNRNVAILTFSSTTLAERALTIFHNLEWNGETLKAEKGYSKSVIGFKQEKNQLSKSVDDKNKNLTVKLHNVPPSTMKSELETFIIEQCKGVKISKLVPAGEGVYIARLESERGCKKVYETLRGVTFNGRKIRTTWTSQSMKKTDEQRPYVVVSNLNLHLQEKAVRIIFNKHCQGVLSAEKKPNDRDFRVYFQSADLAAKAVRMMDGFVEGKKKLKVKLGITASRETQKNELAGQLKKYTAELQRKRVELLNRNDCELKKLEKLVGNLPKKSSKMIPLAEFERREEVRKIYEQKGKELNDQRMEFESKYKELLDRLLVEAQDRRSVNDELGIKKVISKHKKSMAREFNRFEASLPIYAKRREFIETLRKNQVLVLIGETGSGKSTQLAQYLADELFSQPGSIVVTQPRKIAAVSLAKRVAEEYGCSVGEEVGYQVGLSQKVSRKTIIKFVTDRILLNEVLKGNEGIDQYSCIVIDEAHERSIHTDLLLAMLKQNLRQRPSLQLIVTSATLNTEIFRRYFDDCPVITVQGRAFPVERVYVKERPIDYTDGVLEKAVEVCESSEIGDILIFLTQQTEIEKTSERLVKRLGDGNVILPLHGKLQAEEQEKVFKPTPAGKRKIVVATNSAETSITIDGIRIVIDSGMVKEPSFDATRNMTSLDVKMVSQSSANQRAGRAGRTGPGKCYCMYTAEDFNVMKEDTRPEILKMHLGMAVLQLLSLGVKNVEQFDFVQAPPRDTLVTALDSLKQLGALDQDQTLTELGKNMLQLPTDPKLSKALLEGLRRGCGKEIITVVGLMSSGGEVFYRGDTDEKRNACAIQKQEFCSASGDLLSALEVYRQWSKEPEKKRSQWCIKNALNARTLRSTRETVDEIEYALTKLGINTSSHLQVTSVNLEQDLCKSLLAGYSENIAWSRGHEKLGYTVVLSNQNARIHPSSVLSSLGCQPHWILFQEMRHTSETFLLNVTPIESEWLADIAMHMLQFVDEEEIRRSQVVRERIQPVGPVIVKSIIGLRGSTLRQIENSVSEYAAEFPLQTRIVAENQSRVFCSIECNVEKGFVDIYSSHDCSKYAKGEVERVIEKKRRGLLYGGTEIVISKVGFLKALVGNDMKTRLILQPGQFCRFDVFVTKEDETYEVDEMEVIRSLNDAGEVIHYSLREAQNGKWGSVTYSSPEEAKEAKQHVEFGFREAGQLPYNVEKIRLKPCRVEHLQPQNFVSVTDTRVLVTWYPFLSTGRAYIKCTSPEAAYELCSKLSGTYSRGSIKSYRPSVESKTGDIKWSICFDDDEKTVAEKIDACGLQSDAEAISKVVIPSHHNGKRVEIEVEKRKLSELMKKFGKVHVNNAWVANCQKVMARVVFLSLKDAKKAIQDLNGQKGQLGSRAVYLELEGRSEIICNKRLYNKIQNAVENIIEGHGVDLGVKDMGNRGMKITLTGSDAEDVQMIGGLIADVVSPKSVVIEDPAVARSLSNGYGRNKLKMIEKRSGGFVQSSMIGRCIQVTGSREAKQKAFKLVLELLEELKKTTNVEIPLKGCDVPMGAIREMLRKYGKDLKGLVEEDEECQVQMDVRRRKLVLRGSKEDVGNVRAKVEAFIRGLRPHQSISEQNEVCPICIGEVEDPYRLSVCGHWYCSTCIMEYMTSTFTFVKNADMFPQACLYDGCKYPLTRDDFFAFLKKDQIEQLYRVSFESFVIGSKGLYKPCSSPDCFWVYESTSKPEIFVCPECNARVCRSCGDLPHELFDTCEAYKASKDPSKADELYERWVAGANTRKCPKCSVMIEKNKGCNHVHCTQCNAHICWKCGKYFHTEDRCYDHQRDCKR